MNVLPHILYVLDRLLTNPTILMISGAKLLLDGSRSGFFILTSWITIYIPEISVAYRTYCHQFASIGPALQQQKQEIRASLLSLVHSLLDLSVKLFAPGDQMLFKLGGPRGIPLPTDLLLRRCLDVVWICLINIQAADHESQGPDPWPLSGPLIERLKQVGDSEEATGPLCGWRLTRR